MFVKLVSQGYLAYPNKILVDKDGSIIKRQGDGPDFAVLQWLLDKRFGAR